MVGITVHGGSVTMIHAIQVTVCERFVAHSPVAACTRSNVPGNCINASKWQLGCFAETAP